MIAVFALQGLGPDGELQYPAHPRDKRWNYPGVGEFQVCSLLLRTVVIFLQAGCDNGISWALWSDEHDCMNLGQAGH